MFQKITLLALVLIVASCQKKESVEKDKIKIADWLIGNWENTSPDGTLTENWTKLNDSIISAFCIGNFLRIIMFRIFENQLFIRFSS